MARLIPIQQISPNPEDKRQRFRPRPQPRERASERAARIAGIVTSGLGAAANVASTVGGLVDKFGPTDAEKLDEARRKLAVQSRMSPMGVGESEAAGFQVGAAKKKGDFAGGETSGLLNEIVRTRRADPDRPEMEKFGDQVTRGIRTGDLDLIFPEKGEPAFKADEVAEPVPLEISADDAKSIRRAAKIGNRAAKRVQKMLDDETIRVSEDAENIQVEKRRNLAKKLEKRLKQPPAAPQAEQPTGPFRPVDVSREQAEDADKRLELEEDRRRFRLGLARAKNLGVAGIERQLEQNEKGLPTGVTQEMFDKQTPQNQVILARLAEKDAEAARVLLGRRRSLQTAAEIVTSGQDFTTSQLNQLYRGFVEAGDRQEAERIASLAPRALDFSRFMATPGEPEVLTRAKALDAVRAQVDDGRGKGGAQAALKLMADRSRKRRRRTPGDNRKTPQGTTEEPLTYDRLTTAEKAFAYRQIQSDDEQEILDYIIRVRADYKTPQDYRKFEERQQKELQKNPLSREENEALGILGTRDQEAVERARDKSAAKLRRIRDSASLGVSIRTGGMSEVEKLEEKINTLLDSNGKLTAAGIKAYKSFARKAKVDSPIGKILNAKGKTPSQRNSNARNYYIGLLQRAQLDLSEFVPEAEVSIEEPEAEVSIEEDEQ